MQLLDKSKKTIFLILGLTTTVLAFIGIFLPLLPTTPFLLLSAYFFSKSSKRLHNWLLQHKIFGPIINDWEKHGVISVKAKIISLSMIFLLFTYTLTFVQVNLYIKAFVLLSGIGVVTFIVTRPSYPKS